MRLKDLVKAAGGTTGNLFNLPVDMLDPNPDNIRIDGPALREHIRAIANDIIANGYDRTQPLTIRIDGERAVVENGNCRLMAVRVAIAEGCPIQNLPCIPEPEGTKPIDRLARMATRNTGLAHSAAEYAQFIHKFRSYGLSDQAIADRLQKSRQWMHNILTAADAPEDVQAAIAEGTISQTEAVKLIREVGADNAGAAIATAVAETGKARVTAKSLRAAALAGSGTGGKRDAQASHAAPRKQVTPDLVAAVTDFLAAWDGDQDYVPLIDALRGFV